MDLPRDTAIGARSRMDPGDAYFAPAVLSFRATEPLPNFQQIVIPTEAEGPAVQPSSRTELA
jgi:hypothetical protein